ncbi:hypothetical protein NQZ68_032038 [Dissostichus eleginoides]|nr:hypothetical protein NQZ68_032038 [Dissostichus eleginoides]
MAKEMKGKTVRGGGDEEGCRLKEEEADRQRWAAKVGTSQLKVVLRGEPRTPPHSLASTSLTLMELLLLISASGRGECSWKGLDKLIKARTRLGSYGTHENEQKHWKDKESLSSQYP